MSFAGTPGAGVPSPGSMFTSEMLAQKVRLWEYCAERGSDSRCPPQREAFCDLQRHLHVTFGGSGARQGGEGARERAITLLTSAGRGEAAGAQGSPARVLRGER